MQRILEPEKAFAILKKYRVPFADCKLAKDESSAAKAAFKIGFPVAMKVSSKKILHKSDACGVKVGIEDEDEARAAFREIVQNAKKRIGVKPEGVLVQKMESGMEIIIGLKKDPQFGQTVLFGLGGVFVEVMNDVSLRIAPLSKECCLEMVREIKGYPLLSGARGKKPVDVGSLVDILMAVSKIGMGMPEILEMDLNPVIVNENGAKVVDIRVILGK